MHGSEPLRRSIAWCAIFVHAVIASGLPLPLGPVVNGTLRRTAAGEARLATKDRSTPFPCMDTACGCATAEQCFTNCCCRTPAETLAWARARGTSPAVIAALERRVAPATQPAAPACCRAEQSASATRACCKPTVEPACCTAATIARNSEPTGGADRDELSGGRVVVLRAMLACGGVVEQWLAGGGNLPPAAVAWSCPALPCGRVRLVDERLEPALFAPEPRPPAVV